jgi:ankyrin repeat protein
MRIDVTTLLRIPSSLPPASSYEAGELCQLANTKFPFLGYAAQNVLYHSDAAEAGGVSQMSFCQSFQLADWIKVNNMFKVIGMFLRNEAWRNTPKSSLLYILSERNLAALIRAYHDPFKQSCFDVEDETYGAPIFAALATGSNKAVDTLVEICSEKQPQGSQLRELCKPPSESRSRWMKFGSTFEFAKTKSALSYVGEQGDEAFLAFYIAASHGNTMDENGRTPLSWAAENGLEAVVQLLLEAKADIESKDNNYGWTPLSWAAKNGHEAVVQLLLEAEADIESRDIYGQTLLSWAARNGHEAVVQLLLEAKADIESKDNHFDQTPLSLAARNGHKAVLQLLLEAKADIESKDIYGQPPLLWAAANGHRAVVQLLLEAKANTESKDNSGRTPLSWAAANGSNAVVQLLLEAKADIESNDNSGLTPLSWAAGNRREAAVQLLLEAKADIESKDIN